MMKKSEQKTVYTSAPGKIILFGEHAVNRGKAALATAINKRVYCRIHYGSHEGYILISGKNREEGDREKLVSFKEEIDDLRTSQNHDIIRERARDFFAPSRYVLAHLAAYIPTHGISIEWYSQLPIGAGLGSGAATYTSMVHAIYVANNVSADARKIADTAYQGDIIAHGGIASSLDSSTSAFGGFIRYTVESGAERIDTIPQLNLVLGDTLVRTETAEMNTRVRKWLAGSKSRMHIFENVGYIGSQAFSALEQQDFYSIGNLMDLHELLQEMMGTGCSECRRLIETAHASGALGAKITGSGGGGMVIIICRPGEEEKTARSIREAGGVAFSTTAGAEGVRLEEKETWDQITTKNGRF